MNITEIVAGRRWKGWRIAMWGTAAFLLLLPAVAMQFTSEVDWGPGDFMVMGVMLLTACGVRPTWPITGIPRSVSSRTVGAIASPPSSLTAAQPVSFITRAQLANACSGEPS